VGEFGLGDFLTVLKGTLRGGERRGDNMCAFEGL
jgi:hypothetical protein